MAVDADGEGFVDAVDLHEVGDLGAGDAAGGAEMVEQRFLARRADAFDFVERRAGRFGGAFLAVGADGPAVSLVAQAL